MFWYDLTRVATKCARLYLDRTILRYSLRPQPQPPLPPLPPPPLPPPPWHAGHVEITGEKNGRGSLLLRHRQTCLLFRDRSDVEYGCIFRPIVVLLEFMKTSMECALVWSC